MKVDDSLFNIDLSKFFFFLILTWIVHERDLLQLIFLNFAKQRDNASISEIL